MGPDVSTQTSVLSLDAHTQTSQPSATLLRDASQAAPHSAAFKDASTQLPRTEFLLGSLYIFLGMSVAPHFPNPGTSVLSTVSAVPATTVVPFQSPVHSLTAHHLRLLGSKDRHSWECHTSLLKLRPSVPIRIMAPPSPLPSTLTPPTSPPTPQPQVSTTSVRTHTKKECTYRPCGNPLCHWCRYTCWSWCIPEAQACCTAHGTLRTAQTCWARQSPQRRQWSHAPSTPSLSASVESSQVQRMNSTQIFAATCGRFHAVILQEASDHVPHVTDHFTAYTGSTDRAILLDRDASEPNPAVFAFQEASSSKDTRNMVVLVERGLLRRPSLSGSPTVTFCFVHIHKVVAKKRDASTDVLR